VILMVSKEVLCTRAILAPPGQFNSQPFTTKVIVDI
jgi:hypothetical protein